LTMLTRTTEKFAQHSHDIVVSSAINDILKAINDALTLSLVFLNSFSPRSYGVQAGL